MFGGRSWVTPGLEGTQQYLNHLNPLVICYDSYSSGSHGPWSSQFFISELCFFSPKNSHLIGPWLWLLVRKRLNFSQSQGSGDCEGLKLPAPSWPTSEPAWYPWNLEDHPKPPITQLVHHIYMDWFKGTSSRKTPKHGKIDGFRLRFSLQPIHWATQFWENVRNGDLLSLTNPSVASSSYCPSAPQTHVTRKTMVDAKQLQLDSTITGNIISYIFCSMGKDGKMRKPTKIVFLLWFSQSKQLVWFQVFVALAPVYGSNVGSPSCKSHSCSPWQPWPVNPWVTCSRSRFGHTQDLWRTGYVVCLVCIWIHEYKYIYMLNTYYTYIYIYT